VLGIPSPSVVKFFVVAFNTAAMFEPKSRFTALTSQGCLHMSTTDCVVVCGPQATARHFAMLAATADAQKDGFFSSLAAWLRPQKSHHE
jgi:hypothetical protein